MSFESVTIKSADGLNLYVRDYQSQDSSALPVLCLHGFMRTGRDYNDIACHLREQRRVIVPDIRGRGDSGYASDVDGYLLDSLLADAWKILETLGEARVIILGTTLGAMMGMIMANARPGSVAGVILIDQGTETAMEGVMRMFGHGGSEEMTYDEAVASVREQNLYFFPIHTDDDYAQMMLNAHRKNAQGMYVRDLDQVCRGATIKLLEAYGKPDYWDEFNALKIPVLSLRGEFSDYLTEEIVDKMRAAKTDFTGVTIPGVGHPPQLKEPASIAAIDSFLAQL